ncbi:MarR family winged helix-turn-helix transcriptional regulator [Nocardia donostiensis]|uniref:MarR family transcriptional regulator n=1 Tax=Nocardia donostiensis TaxID=1538463 RepID=A0A1W0B9P9_9NOCA|nr:MarR family winged helix-turn-helix transcriptional regulator [Nocardia donostiensis]ONM46853.1 MarR family transcriptional regulator [Nocardia donostiensis]OQS13202.1 MarR family transcriptional regulator [Nocardia donostiensis]OQS19111.1 MarR family transcriptional regulator [Nocardia donostiensis]
MSTATGGHELPLRMLLGFRSAVDEVHAELAENGHPDLRPLHGFVFQAIGRAGGRNGCTAADLGRILGISKQAAGKHVESLERLGYLAPGRDPADARRKVYTLTPRAVDALEQSERAFARTHRRWAATIGAERLAALEADLRLLVPGEIFGLDTPSWFAGR